MVSEFVNDQIHSIAREIDKKDRIPKDMVGKLGEMLLRESMFMNVMSNIFSENQKFLK